MRRLSILVLGCCLAAGACTAADDETSSSTPDTAAATTAASAGADTTAAPSEPGTEAATTVASTAPLSSEPGVGVTDDTIKLGVLYTDLDKIKDVLPNLNHGDDESAFNAIAASINDAGGINGRKLELVFGAVDVLDFSQAVGQCVRLIEDEQVFAIIGPGTTADSTQCIVTDHATPMVGGTQTPAQLAAAKAPWFTPDMGSQGSTAKLVEVLLDRGMLDGKKVGILANPADKVVADATEATLKDAGVDVTTVAVMSDTGGDVAASRAEVQTFLGRMRADGADTFLPINDAVVVGFQEVAASDWRPQLFTSNLNAFLGYLVAGGDTSILDGLFGTGSPLESNAYTEAPAQDCVKRVLAVEPDREIAAPDAFDAGTPDTFVSVMTACQNLDLFAAIATKAGPVLNADTFRAAGESLGKIDLPMHGGTSDYTKDTPDGDSPVFVATWDSATKSLEYETTPAA